MKIILNTDKQKFRFMKNADFPGILQRIESGDRIKFECLKIFPSGHLFYAAESCTSSMDLAWYLREKGAFPDWSSVLAENQTNGRGQFRRKWNSPPGNLYASLCLPSNIIRQFTLIPSLIAFSIQNFLRRLGISSEYKWPNDILVSRKKVGGILVEEKKGVLIAGIGINLSNAPVLEDPGDTQFFPAAHLYEFGLLLKPLEIWPFIVREVYNQAHFFFNDEEGENLLKELEKRMAFIGENVMFKSPYGRKFPAMVAGLSITGGIRLITADGEKIQHTGSIFPIYY